MFLNFFLALIPIIWLIAALGFLKMPGFKACLIALAITALEALFYWKLTPIQTGSAALEGILNALWPICLVIIAALFTYNITVETGAMNTIKKMLTAVSDDKRILMLIIAWGFGTFMEGMAGFGTAVAIPASMLVAIGFEAIPAVAACLIINSTPTAFGSVGIPVVTMSSITGLSPLELSSATVIIQFVITFISPFIAVIIIGKGIKALKGVIVFTLIAALSLIIPQFITAKFIGPELADISSSIFSMLCIVAAAKLIPHKTPEEFKALQENSQEGQKITFKSAIKAWSPFMLIFFLLLCTSNLFPKINAPLSQIKTSAKIFMGENSSTLTFKWINTPGVMIFIAAFIGAFIQKAPLKKQIKILSKTLTSNLKTIITISSVLAVAKIMGYSGMVSDIAKVLVAGTGSFFPLFSPLIGIIGGFITGSGTSTTVLFGNLQKETALAISSNPAWLCAANMMGAGIGKMICPQSIAIGCAAAGLSGSESIMLKKSIVFCLAYAVLGGILCYFIPFIIKI